MTTTLEAGDDSTGLRPVGRRLTHAVRSYFKPAGRLALVGASLATSGLLWLAYFPVAWGWLGCG